MEAVEGQLHHPQGVELAEVLDGTIAPGRVFDLEVPLDDVAEAYAAMDERRAVKSLLRP